MKIKKVCSNRVTLKPIHGNEESFKLTDIVQLIVRDGFYGFEYPHYIVKLTDSRKLSITKEDYNELKDYLDTHEDLAWTETCISYANK